MISKIGNADWYAGIYKKMSQNAKDIQELKTPSMAEPFKKGVVTEISAEAKKLANSMNESNQILYDIKP